MIDATRLSIIVTHLSKGYAASNEMLDELNQHRKWLEDTENYNASLVGKTVIKPQNCGKTSTIPMLIDNETLRKQIENDPDVETEAGSVYNGPATFFRGDVTLKEGPRQKGGINPPPTSPRPEGSPGAIGGHAGATIECVLSGKGRPCTPLERWLTDPDNAKHQYSTTRGTLRNGDLYSLAEAIYETLKEQK